MNAYAVVNPLLEAIYYFKMKANGETPVSYTHLTLPTKA